MISWHTLGDVLKWAGTIMGLLSVIGLIYARLSFKKLVHQIENDGLPDDDIHAFTPEEEATRQKLLKLCRWSIALIIITGVFQLAGLMLTKFFP